MKFIGTITRLQIQREPLKVGMGKFRHYRTAPILSVAQLRLTPLGVLGVTESGEVITDVHHVEHPRSRNRGGVNGVSVNFVPNYDRMHQRFGEHLTAGSAGENILVTTGGDFSMDELHTELVIESRRSGSQITLSEMMVAAPCAPFATFAVGRPVGGAAMREALQFLADGTRGFYLTLASAEADALVEIGDRVYLVPER